MMMRMLLGLARRRQLHTFISKETIKPSSPTPTHLKTYNLSILDQVKPRVYMPAVFFYPNYFPTSTNSSLQAKAAQLKKSLSQALAQCYPLSGRLTAAEDGAFVDCNDEGVDFLEVRSDASLSKLMHLHESEYQPVDHFFPSCTASAWDPPASEGWDCLLRVQLTYFSCGGISLAVSMSHKIGDGCSLFTFMNYWASITRGKSCNDKVKAALPAPHFVFSPNRNISSVQEIVLDKGNNCVTKKFVFPNSKLQLLKAEVMKEDNIMTNPTRIEVLNSLLYGCAVRASKAANSDKYNSVKNYVLMQVVNIRKRKSQPLPDTYMGNMLSSIAFQTMNESELALHSLSARIRSAKMQLMEVTDSQIIQQRIQASEQYKNITPTNKTVGSQMYACSSLCGFQAYDVNFGWGKPIRVTISGCPMKNFFILMDTPNSDGIEALVALEEEDMAIFLTDDQLLAFAL